MPSRSSILGPDACRRSSFSAGASSRRAGSSVRLERGFGCQDHRISARRGRRVAALRGAGAGGCRQPRLDGRSDLCARPDPVPYAGTGNLDPLALVAGGAARSMMQSTEFSKLSPRTHSSSISGTASCRTPVAHVAQMVTRVARRGAERWLLQTQDGSARWRQSLSPRRSRRS